MLQSGVSGHISPDNAIMEVMAAPFCFPPDDHVQNTPRPRLHRCIATSPPPPPGHSITASPRARPLHCITGSQNGCISASPRPWTLDRNTASPPPRPDHCFITALLHLQVSVLCAASLNRRGLFLLTVSLHHPGLILMIASMHHHGLVLITEWLSHHGLVLMIASLHHPNPGLMSLHFSPPPFPGHSSRGLGGSSCVLRRGRSSTGRQATFPRMNHLSGLWTLRPVQPRRIQSSASGRPCSPDGPTQGALTPPARSAPDDPVSGVWPPFPG